MADMTTIVSGMNAGQFGPEDLASILENCIDDPDQKLQQRAFKYFSRVTTANHIPRYTEHSSGEFFLKA